MAVSAADDNGTVFDFQRDSVVISRLAQILRFPLECEKQSLEKGEHPEYRERIASARQWFDRRLEQIRIDEMEEKATICREYEEGMSQLEQEYAMKLKELEESFFKEEDEQKWALGSQLDGPISPSGENGDELPSNCANQTAQCQLLSTTMSGPVAAIGGKKFLRSRQNDVNPSSSGCAKTASVGLGLTDGAGTVGGVKRRAQGKKSGSPFGFLGSGRAEGTSGGFSCAGNDGPTVGGTSISSLTIPCLLSEAAISEDVNSLSSDSAAQCISTERPSLGGGLCQDGGFLNGVGPSATARHSVRGEKAVKPEKKTSQWRKVDESKLDSESALFRWIGSHSVELEVRGSALANFKGFSFKKPSTRKVVEKEPKKRGRPRLNPESVQSSDEPRKPRGRPPKLPPNKCEKPITLNEQLHSLVAESIALRSLGEKRSESGLSTGRRTNNSLNVSLEMDQRQDVVSQQPFKIPKKPSQTPKQNCAKSPLPAFKRPKVEPSDFELPANFRANISVSYASNFSSSPSVRPTTQRNAFQWAADRPCTSSSLAARPPLSNGQVALANSGTTNSSMDNLAGEEHREQSDVRAEEQIEAALVTNGTMAEDEQRKERRRDGAAAEDEVQQTQRTKPDGTNEDDERHLVVRARVPIFSARTFDYEVDVASAVVRRFESAQVVDIFNRLPPAIDPRLKSENGDGIRPTVPTLDRLILRQEKGHQRTAQAFFCGGPLSALAICPRATNSGRELIAISTFADERMLKVEKEDEDAFVQLWTTNPKDLSDKARFECLLRVPKAEHISSLSWCPTLDDDFEAFRKADRSKQKSSRQGFAELTKESLGLLAVGTHSGRIEIFSVPSEFETLINKTQSDCQRTDSLPLIFDSDPLFTLLHPAMAVDESSDAITSKGNNGMSQKNTDEKSVEGNEHKGQEEKALQSFEPSSPTASAHSSVPLFCLNWSPFSGGRYIGAVSPIGHVLIWDLLRPALPTWKLHFDEWNSPPLAFCWMGKNKIAISFRRRLFRIYGLLSPSESDQFGSSQPVLECDLNKTCGSRCCSQPLLFPGLISYESATFSYFGTTQQAPSYIWVAPPPDGESEKEHICASTLSNCHQIQNNCVSVCQLSGLCVSVGADGRMACSLNGRMAPIGGGDGENLMLGRALLHLIMHNKSLTESEENENFCFSHDECCNHRKLEVRLGDCALIDQENERVCRRHAPEVCPGRRLESLTFCEFSRSCAGLTYCGGESGLVFVVPSTL